MTSVESEQLDSSLYYLAVRVSLKSPGITPEM